MNTFEQRLSKAIERGHRRSAERALAEREKALSEEELRQLHSKYRLQFSERIEQCLQQLPHHFPGFQYETMFGDRGWGGACSRDDVRARRGNQRGSSFSRLEMTIRPYSPTHVVELVAKGTIRNKEVYDRRHFEMIHQVDNETFSHLIDAWVLEYAELYAAEP